MDFDFVEKILKNAAVQKIGYACFLAISWLETRYRYRQPTFFYLEEGKEEFFAKVMQFLKFNAINGDYLEFGCYRGITFELAHAHKHLAGLNMHLYAFDSFQGMPKPKGIDVRSPFHESDQAMSIKQFTEKLKVEGITDAEYSIVPGFYDQSLKENPPEKIGLSAAALVYVDCVYYESTVPVLDYVLPLLQTGSVIAFDDFYCFCGDPERGQQLALKEFLQKNPEITLTEYLNINWHGKSFIVKKRHKA
jgi:O-methyltransferase